MTITRAILTETDQVILIPSEYQLPDEELVISRVGDVITLTPKSKWQESFLQALDSFSDDFMADYRLE